ncbi:hypothetical protein ABID52_000631 [Fictibacillus halophilus]|uniref:Uncharacterized protein n=1 Tax=Fictibacillus halophilus TaxID=1610490 RepID=A0ABV2LEN3_9BACL|nr:hypothetical protein [Fictibacillus halophilus]
MTEENRLMTGVFEKENYCDSLVVQDRNIITPKGRAFIRFGTLFGNTLNLIFDESWYKE